MDEAKKYGVVAFFGALAIVSSMAADISDFLSGIVLGFGCAIIVFALYKMATLAAKAKKQDQPQDSEN